MNRLIESIKDAPHDALIVAGMFSIPVLIALWIVNRMRHPERGLLHALVIASVGFVLVPCVSSGGLILWSRASGLTRPLAEAIRGFGWGFVVVPVPPFRRGRSIDRERRTNILHPSRGGFREGLPGGRNKPAFSI